MTVSVHLVWVVGVVAGLVSGLLSPLLLSWFQHHVFWRRQKKFELQYGAFEDSVRALGGISDYYAMARARLFADGNESSLRLRETVHELTRTRGLVRELFTKSTSAVYGEASTARIVNALGTADDKFQEQYNELGVLHARAISAMAKELGLKG